MPGPLDGVRIVEACGPVGHYAGRLLANLGADVVKVEPPEGDAGRSQPPFLPGVPAIEGSLPFLLHNANKRGVALDLATVEGRSAFLKLLGGADVLLESWTEREQRALGIDDEEIEAAAPALVRTSITGWGRSGPRAGWASADIVACAMSGVMRLAGFPDGPPEQLPDQQALRCASIQAAAGTLAALLHREETGVGQLVEVSMQEALLMAMETAVCTFDILGTDRERTGLEPAILRGAKIPGHGLYRCADGFVYLMAAGTAGSGFQGVVELMQSAGAAEDLTEEPYASFIADSLYRNLLIPLLEEDSAQSAAIAAKLEHIGAVLERFLATQTKRDLYEQGQAKRVLIGMVSTPEDVAASPQLAARDWFVDLPDPGRECTLRYPGPPWRLAGTPATLRLPAPLLGQHNGAIDWRAEPSRGAARPGGDRAQTLPLAGVRLLDLTWFGAGPIATRVLAALGADVIRIETEKRPDGLRVVEPRPPGSTSLNVSGYFNSFNSDKRSIAIDLTTPRGHELGIELVRWADLFMTNMTNRAVRQIGMTWEHVQEANPGIVALYQPMHGLDGPHADFQGFGAIVCTICGANHLAGYEDNPPVGVGTNYPDYVVNPMHALVALLAALRHRRRTGEGQLIDLSQLESSVAAMAGPLFASMNAGVRYRRSGNRSEFAAPHGAYPVAGDDNWIAIACLDDASWALLAGAMGQPALVTDPRFATLAERKANEDALDAIVAVWSCEQDGGELMARLQEQGIPAGLAQRASEVIADPHLAARGYFQRLPHAEAGTRIYDGFGFRLSRTPIRPTRAAPLLGEHTYEIATEVLGLTPDEIADLVGEGVLV